MKTLVIVSLESREINKFCFDWGGCADQPNPAESAREEKWRAKYFTYTTVHPALITSAQMEKQTWIKKGKYEKEKEKKK